MLGCNGLMDFQQALAELKENTNALRKQCRLKTLRRILKFLLLGFFIGRDYEKRISELISKNDLLLKSMLRRFEDYEAVRGYKHQASGSIAYSQLADDRQYVDDLARSKKCCHL
jgi:hypothetical protein